MFRVLAERFGWTVEQVGRMTFAQVNMYLSADSGGNGAQATPRFRSLPEFRSWLARKGF